MTDLERAKAQFSSDLFATQVTGVEILEASAGHAKCMLHLEPRHMNCLGVPMGGAIFTLADYAYAIASNFDQKAAISTSGQITYLSQARGDTLYAVADSIRSGRSTNFFKIEITDNLGNDVAYMTMNGFVLPEKKSPQK
jgi:acyl-CoA thioesterase